jgi:hypothetical protein
VLETKEAAQAEVAKIDASRRGGDKARTIMLEAAKSNDVFRQAFDAATSSKPDKNRINAQARAHRDQTWLTHSDQRIAARGGLPRKLVDS